MVYLLQMALLLYLLRDPVFATVTKPVAGKVLFFRFVYDVIHTQYMVLCMFCRLQMFWTTCQGWASSFVSEQLPYWTTITTSTSTRRRLRSLFSHRLFDLQDCFHPSVLLLFTSQNGIGSCKRGWTTYFEGFSLKLSSSIVVKYDQ